MWSFLGALDEAPESSDEETILRLYEASLPATVRIRHAPSKAQLVLEQIAFSESLRVQNLGAGAISFLEFLVHMAELPEVTPNDTGMKLMKAVLCRTMVRRSRG
jgi:hypothetical protein